MDQPLRKLPIDLSELEGAFTTSGNQDYLHFYLDLETGAVILITEDDLAMVEDFFVQYIDPQTGEVNLDVALDDPDVPILEDDSQYDVIASLCSEADKRYLDIPSDDSDEGYRDMAHFIPTVTDRRLRQRLENAIDGGHPFRRFKDVLLDYPAERQRWFAFSNDRLRQRMLDWLAAEGIEVVEE